MKQGKIIAAYYELLKLNRIPGLPFAVCNRLYLLKSKLQPYFDSQLEQENVILEAHGQTSEHCEITPEISKEFKAISESEVDYDFKPVEIVVTDGLAEKMGLTGEIIGNLDGFVIFTEG